MTGRELIKLIKAHGALDLKVVLHFEREAEEVDLESVVGVIPVNRAEEQVLSLRAFPLPH